MIPFPVTTGDNWRCLTIAQDPNTNKRVYEMPVNTKVKDIVNKVFDGGLPTADDIRFLLSIEAHSVDSGFIMGCADEVNRTSTHVNFGEISGTQYPF